MSIAKTAGRVFGVLPGEGRTASLMVLHSFAMGTGTVFFETAASALFLERFGAGVLPWVYIAAAVVNTLTGVVYTALQQRARFERLMLGTLAMLLAGILLLRAGVASGGAVLLFSLLVFYRMLSALTDLEYWAVATRLYDVRQAKRLFGLVGSGEVVARIAGSFSVPLLVGALGVPNLMLVSAAGIAACLALASAVFKGASEREAPRKAAKPKPALAEALRLVSNPYLGLLLAITFFAILGKYFVDFAFLEQMRARHADAKGLATFFAIFSGVTQALSLLTRVLLSGPLLSRFGIRVGLLVLPVTQVLCTAAIVAAGFAEAGYAVFWLVIANQGVYKVLKHPIDNPSFKVLYQPLRPEQRLAAQITVETIVTPVTTGVAGGVMLLFTRVIAYDPVRFALALLVTFVGWVWVARRAGRAYPEALSDALRGRIADEQLDFDDARARAVLEQTLRSGKPGEVLFALDLLEKAEHPRLAALLVELLEHPAPEVRGSVLSRLERLRPRDATEAVRRRVAAEDRPAVRAAALRCLAALGGSEAAGEVARFLGDPDPQVQRAALIGLLQAEAEPGPAAAHLDALVGSAAEDKRHLAAHVLGEVARPGLGGALRRLLADPARGVRRAALASAARAKVKDAALVEDLARNLGDPAYAGLAALALAAAGQEALPVLERAWPDAAPTLRARIARILGRIGGPRARAFLRSALDGSDQRVRQEALDALGASGYAAGEGEREALLAQVREEAGDSAWELACLRDLGADGDPLVVSALERELRENRRRVFQLLAFVYDPVAILRARDHLADATKDKRAYALEILDVTLARDTKEIVLPLCEELAVEERCRRLAPHFDFAPRPRDERLRELVARPDAWLTPWARACAVYGVGRLGLRGLAGEVRAAHAGGEGLVRETAGWALARLGQAEAGASAGRGRMLTIEKVIRLKGVEMFERASEEVLADIAAILEEVEHRPGDLIIRKGELGDSMYIVVEGQVRVFDGDRTITTLGENEIFGELALLDPEPRNASIEAVTETRLFRLDREAFSELMAANIEIVRGVLGVLCDRLRKKAY